MLNLLPTHYIFPPGKFAVIMQTISGSKSREQQCNGSFLTSFNLDKFGKFDVSNSVAFPKSIDHHNKNNFYLQQVQKSDKRTVKEKSVRREFNEILLAWLFRHSTPICRNK